MKKKNIILFGSLIFLVSIFSITCKKAADKVFDGSARIRGVVYFTNIQTTTVDTAQSAVITMTQSGNSGVNFVDQLTNGTFDINYLKAGTYNFNIRFTYKVPGATKSDVYTLQQAVKLTEGQFSDNFAFTLSVDSVSSPTMQLTVTDASGVAVNNAQVCLYSDPLILAANRETCAGSLVSGVTNSKGIILFNGLQMKSYYASVYTVAGKDTISNMASDMTALPVLSANKLTLATVSIANAGYIIQLLVQNQQGANLPNANVSLYTDTALLVKYRNTGNGNLMSGKTNAQGIVTFYQLQQLTYFVSSYYVAGSDTLTNKATDKTMGIFPAANSLNTKIIIDK